MGKTKIILDIFEATTYNCICIRYNFNKERDVDLMDTKFSIAVHALIMICEADRRISSEIIAASAGTNSSHVRKIISLLKKAEILERRSGGFEYSPVKDKSQLTLFEIYNAVRVNNSNLLSTHQNSRKSCPVGGYINMVLDPIVEEAERRLEQYLQSKTLQNVIDGIRKELKNDKISSI